MCTTLQALWAHHLPTMAAEVPTCMYISAMPPTMTATLPFFRIFLKFADVASTEPSQAMKWRQKGMLNTLLAARL
jgi:hypothetical protein